MKKTFFVLGITAWLMPCLLLPRQSIAQNKGKSNDISINFNLPIGNFSNTHKYGIGTEYSWSSHRFGKLVTTTIAPFGFTFNAGADYYKGKTETVGIIPYTDTFQYSGYTYVHAYAGIIYNPCDKENIRLTAGPALGLSDGHVDFNIGVELSGTIYLVRSARLGITPVLTLMKETNTDPLYTAGIRLSVDF